MRERLKLYFFFITFINDLLRVETEIFIEMRIYECYMSYISYSINYSTITEYNLI